jgi:hypothetical protein
MATNVEGKLRKDRRSSSNGRTAVLPAWVSMKDVKNSYPVQLAEYATQRRIAGEPAFAWWIRHVLHKRNRIIAKLKTKYWVSRSHKFGVKIPKSVKEAKKFDEENGNTLWWDAICKEMKNV